MVFKNIFVILLRAKVALALKGLNTLIYVTYIVRFRGGDEGSREGEEASPPRGVAQQTEGGGGQERVRTRLRQRDGQGHRLGLLQPIRQN